MNAIAPRDTVEHIVKCRNDAIALYEDAFAKIAEAGAAVSAAADMWRRAAPKMETPYGGEEPSEVRAFLNAVKVPERDGYIRTARKLIDVSVWWHLIQLTNIESLMDAQSKKELHQQMRYIPDKVSRRGEVIDNDEIAKMLPEITVGNVMATMEKFMAESDMIFRRGLVNAFAKLDRRFRSHDGFKIGDRVILNRLVSGDGYLSEYGYQQDALRDIERAFRILDGGDPRYAEARGILWQIGAERPGWKVMQSEHEGEFFKVRIFMNGNAHLWFTRKDLLKKANRILAEWYGEVVGDGQTKEADPLGEVKTTPARNYGFFPTPQGAAAALFRPISLHTPIGAPPLRILEPSAGTGNLAVKAVTRPGGDKDGYWQTRGYQLATMVDCVEIQPSLAGALERQGIYNKVIRADFLTVTPQPIYDCIVMNPPFDRERDIDHVNHALKFLKPGGELHAIMSAGTEFRGTAKSEAFREMMQRMGARWEDLPAGSFSEVGTNVNTLIVRVRKAKEA